MASTARSVARGNLNGCGQRERVARSAAPMAPTPIKNRAQAAGSGVPIGEPPGGMEPPPGGDEPPPGGMVPPPGGWFPPPGGDPPPPGGVEPPVVDGGLPRRIGGRPPPPVKMDGTPGPLEPEPPAIESPGLKGSSLPWKGRRSESASPKERTGSVPPEPPSDTCASPEEPAGEFTWVASHGPAQRPRR